MPPRKLPQNNCPLYDCSRKITPKIIAPDNIPLEIAASFKFEIGNSDDLSRPRSIVARINYTRYIFSPRIKNRSTLIDSLAIKTCTDLCGLNRSDEVASTAADDD